jgi:hypothetical protein
MIKKQRYLPLYALKTVKQLMQFAIDHSRSGKIRQMQYIVIRL